jgi:hypothetical protein
MKRVGRTGENRVREEWDEKKGKGRCPKPRSTWPQDNVTGKWGEDES